MGRQPKWSSQDKVRIVLSVLREETTMAEASRRHGVSATSIGKWKEQFLEAGAAGVASGGGGPSVREEQLERQLDEVKIALGEATAELRGWRKGGSLYSAGRTSR